MNRVSFQECSKQNINVLDALRENETNPNKYEFVVWTGKIFCNSLWTDYDTSIEFYNHYKELGYVDKIKCDIRLKEKVLWKN